MSGSGISWTICKSAPCPRQITMPALHHSGWMPFLPPYQQRQLCIIICNYDQITIHNFARPALVVTENAARLRTSPGRASRRACSFLPIAVRPAPLHVIADLPTVSQKMLTGKPVQSYDLINRATRCGPVETYIINRRHT